MMPVTEKGPPDDRPPPESTDERGMEYGPPDWAPASIAMPNPSETKNSDLLRAVIGLKPVPELSVLTDNTKSIKKTCHRPAAIYHPEAEPRISAAAVTKVEPA
jgi:hypothetical protein